jgi:hypothetical protein
MLIAEKPDAPASGEVANADGKDGVEAEVGRS